MTTTRTRPAAPPRRSALDPATAMRLVPAEHVPLFAGETPFLIAEK